MRKHKAKLSPLLVGKLIYLFMWGVLVSSANARNFPVENFSDSSSESVDMPVVKGHESQNKTLRPDELRVIKHAEKEFREKIFPNLVGAVWAPYDTSDKTNPQTKAYCSKKMDKLRAGNITYFPTPMARSSEMDIQKFEKLLQEKTLQASCGKSKYLNFFLLRNAPIKPYVEWLYALPNNEFTRLYLNPKNDDIYIEASLNKCNDVLVLRSEKVNAKEQETVPGFFTEQDIALVEIDGDLFAMEGGTLIMGESDIWRSNIHESLFNDYYEKTYLQPVKPERFGMTTSLIKTQYKLSAEQQKSYDKSGTWLGRIFVLYPLDPPWRDYYRKLKISSDELIQGEDGLSSYSKPCMWNIPD